MRGNQGSLDERLDFQLTEIVSELQKRYPDIIACTIRNSGFDNPNENFTVIENRARSIAIGDSNLKNLMGNAYPYGRSFSHISLCELDNGKFLLLQDFIIGYDVMENDQISIPEIKAVAKLLVENIGSYEPMHYNRDGKYFWSHINAVPFKGDPEQIKRFAISRIDEYIRLCKNYISYSKLPDWFGS